MSNYVKMRMQSPEQSAADCASVAAYFGSSVNVPYSATDEQRQWLAQSFPRNYVTFDKVVDGFEHGQRTRKVIPRLLDSEHPHASFWNDYARNYCYARSIGVRTVEVGANIDDVIYSHAPEWDVVNCVVDAHDELRQLSKLRNPRNDVKAEAKRLALKTSYESTLGCNGRYCFNGVGVEPTLCEGLHKPVDHLISVDSAYDIHPKKMGEFMRRRGVKTGTVAMLLPSGLHQIVSDCDRTHSDHGIAVMRDKTQTQVEMVTDPKIVYYFEGQVNQVAYRHSWVTLIEWLYCKPQRLDDGSNLFIQVERTCGPLVIMDLLVTNRKIDELVVHDTTATIGVKSLQYYATTGMTRVYNIPKFIHQSMMTYIMSNPGLTFKDVVNYYRATKNNFVIAGQRLFEPTNFKADELNDMLHSLVFSIEVDLRRNEQYVPLAEAQYEIHKSASYNFIFGSAGAFFRRMLIRFFVNIVIPALCIYNLFSGMPGPMILLNVIMGSSSGIVTLIARIVFSLLMGSISVEGDYRVLSKLEFGLLCLYSAETFVQLLRSKNCQRVASMAGYDMGSFSVYYVKHFGKIFQLHFDDWKVNENRVSVSRVSLGANNIALRILNAPINMVKSCLTYAVGIPGRLINEVMVQAPCQAPSDDIMDVLKQLEMPAVDNATAEIERRLAALRSEPVLKPVEVEPQTRVALQEIKPPCEPSAIGRCPDDLVQQMHLREYIAALEQGEYESQGKPALRELLFNVREQLESCEFATPRCVRVIWGGPGCGKSTYVAESVRDFGVGKCMWVVATNENCKEQRLKHPGLASCIDTVHRSMSVVNIVRPERVYIDEAFLQGPGVLAAFSTLHPMCDYYLVGDFLQIEFVDFSSLQPLTKAGLHDFMAKVQLGVVKHLNINYRNPSNVVDLMNREFGYNGDMRMTAVKGPDTFRVIEDANKMDAQATCIGLYQNDKNRCNGLITTHESQGNDYDATEVWISPGPITAKANYLRVALTRSKGPTIVYLAPGAKEQIAEFNIASASHEIQSVAIAPMVPHVRDVEVKVANDVSMCLENPFTDMVAVDEILSIDGMGVEKPYAEPVLTELAKTAPTNLKLNLNAILASYQQESDVHTLPTRTYAKHYDPKDMVMRLKTMLGRYARNKHTNVIGAKKLARVMFKRVQPYLGGCAVNTFDVIAAAFDTCESMQNKGTDRSLKGFDVSGKTVVDFFHKNQFKVKLGAGPENMNTEKVGQGIAAHDKQENCHALILTRAIFHAFKRSIDRRIILYNELQPREVHLEMKKRGLTPSDFDTVYNDDETEFDSSQDETTTEFLRMVFAYALRETGLAIEPHVADDNTLKRGDGAYLDLLLNVVVQRVFVARGLAVMNVQNSKDSGDWETWLGNTIWKFGLTFTRYRVKSLKMFLVGGDDGSFLGEREVDDLMFNTLKERGYSVKESVTRGHFEFCGHMYTYDGVCPNILKLVKKLHTKRFDPNLIVDYAQSVRDVMRTYFATHDDRAHCAQVMRYVYPEMLDENVRSLISYYGSYSKAAFLRRRLIRIKKYSPMVEPEMISHVSLADLQSW